VVTVHDKWLEEPPATLSEGTKLIAKIVVLGMANKIEWTLESIDAPRSLVLGQVVDDLRGQQRSSGYPRILGCAC
jgi:hypothetical protein